MVNNLFTLSKLVPLLSFGIVVAIYLAVMAVCIGVLGDQLGATTELPYHFKQFLQKLLDQLVERLSQSGR